MAFNVKLNIYIYIYNVRVNGHPVHQEGMLSNNLRQYVASNSKLDSYVNKWRILDISLLSKSFSSGIKRAIGN